MAIENGDSRECDIGGARILLRGWAMLRGSWRPMLAYTLLVWACSSVLLTPLATWLLHQLAGFGDVIVGNYSIHLWLLTPRGILYLLLSGSVVLFTIIVHAAGLYQIADASRKGALTAGQSLRGILAEGHSFLRLSLGFFLLGLVFVPVLAVGPGLAKLVLLSEHDINYYLTHHPFQWYLAIAVSVIWVLPVVGLPAKGGFLNVLEPTKKRSPHAAKML